MDNLTTAGGSDAERGHLARAHQHGANADDYLSQGLLVLSAEEHTKAATAYIAAADEVRSDNNSLKNTLKMLQEKHTKAAKELHRKISKLQEQDKDIPLPQKPPHALDNHHNQSHHKQQHQQPAVQSFRQVHSSASPRHQSPSRTNTVMTDSSGASSLNNVDESFMLLGGQKSDPGDAFNRFWNIMQGMLEDLSQPVAFATAPLGEPSTSNGRRRGDRNASLSSSSSDEDEERENKATPVADEPFDDDELDDGDELSESFCLLESSPQMLKRDNAALKAQVDEMQRRLADMSEVLKRRRDDDMKLRESIVLAKREFQAQRAMGASAVLPTPRTATGTGVIDFAALNINMSPIPGVNATREAQYTGRIRELENELKGVRAENEKQKAMITKFRERWDKLKDSAKRKKEAKAVAAAAAGRAEGIAEEPEEDGDDGKF